MFRKVATKKPRNPPITILGAKTPPSPPEANVTEVMIGFNIKIPTIETKKAIVKFVLGWVMISLIP